MQYEGDNMMGVKRTNRSAALRILHERGSISRKRLAESIKLSPTAITKIVGDMIAEGLVIEGSTVPSGSAGRREVMVILNSTARCALGVQLNKGFATVSAVWLDGSVIFSDEISYSVPAPAKEVALAASEKLFAMCRKHKIENSSIVGLGISVSGILDESHKLLCNSYGIFDSENIPFCDIFQELTGLPVVMDRTVRALFEAQMFLSKEKSIDSQFFLHCDNNIDAALFINNRICQGAFQRCAEIGHIPMVRRGGKPCSCGKCGCLETIASPSAILEDAKAVLSPERTPILFKTASAKSLQELSLEDIFDAARYGDQGVAEIVDNAVYALAAGLKGVVYLVDPGKIVLYGKIFDNPYYLAKLLAELGEGVDAGHGVVVEKSARNGYLEGSAAGILAVEDFFARGGVMI